MSKSKYIITHISVWRGQPRREPRTVATCKTTRVDVDFGDESGPGRGPRRRAVVTAVTLGQSLRSLLSRVAHPPSVWGASRDGTPSTHRGLVRVATPNAAFEPHEVKFKKNDFSWPPRRHPVPGKSYRRIVLPGS